MCCEQDSKARKSAQKIIAQFKEGNPVVISFWILIIAFTIIGTAFILVNDFSSEILPIIFPVIGAILFSIYLGINSVFINAPKDEEVKIPIAIMVDRDRGDFHSMHILTITDDIKDMDKFKGLQRFNMLNGYTNFKDVDFNARLIKSQPLKQPDFLLNMVEFSFLEWLSWPENIYNIKDNQKIYTISGSGGGMEFLNVPTTSIEVKDTHNILLEKYPINLKLPMDSVFQLKREADDFVVTPQIESPYSILSIRIYESASGTFDSRIGKVGINIAKKLGIVGESPNLNVRYFWVNFKLQRKPFNRFAKQSILEHEWFKRLTENYKKDFSWEELRSLYLRD
jgi:hypothetical protein